MPVVPVCAILTSTAIPLCSLFHYSTIPPFHSLCNEQDAYCPSLCEAVWKGAEGSEARKMPGKPILRALRGQLAFLARLRSISRENIWQFSGETLSFLRRNESISQEKRKCFSGETKAFLRRNGSSSRQTAIDISKDK